MAFPFARKQKKKNSAAKMLPLDVEVNGKSVRLHLRRHDRARRMTLRFNPRTTDFSLTLPHNVNPLDARAFAHEQAGWIEKQLAKAIAPIALVPGTVVPVRGVDHFIRHAGPKRGAVWREDMAEGLPVLWVTGEAPHIQRRVTDWLKKQARADLGDCVARHAQNMGLAYSAISVRDQKSRWGSCSSAGTLSFSWRLIMAPRYVLDYVAAHEVAHIAHMNHGPDFWSLVERSFPETKRAKAWLKAHGAELHRYGA